MNRRFGSTALRLFAFVSLLGGLFALAGCTAAPDRAVDGPPEVLILVSIDGFASYYLDDPRADVPVLRRLAREGASARRMEVSFPSVTWTCHTTLVTGVSPARHGVISNRFFDRVAGKEVAFIGDAVFTKDEAVRVPTLYDAAHAAGLKTASIIWPAAVGARSLDWIIPDSDKEDLHRKYTTPGLAEELEAAGLSIRQLGRWGWEHIHSAPRDDLYTRIAVHVLDRHRPRLVLLHLITPDGVEHDHGPQTPEAYWAVRYADQRIGEIVAAIERPALRGSAALMVVSDHGFLGHTKEIRPNALLVREGLVELDAQKKPARRKAWAVANGGTAAVYVLDEDPVARVALTERLRKLFDAAEGVERVLGPEEFTKLGLPDPKVNPRQGDLMLHARDGFAFTGAYEGEPVVVLENGRGAHGHDPRHPRMGAIFIAWGAGIRPGVKLDEVRAIDVAPTAARLLGIEMPGVDGRVVEEILLPAAARQGM